MINISSGSFFGWNVGGILELDFTEKRVNDKMVVMQMREICLYKEGAQNVQTDYL